SFFFQAEDGIRDFHVTGVQTCALRSGTSASEYFTPSLLLPLSQAQSASPAVTEKVPCPPRACTVLLAMRARRSFTYKLRSLVEQIGRASCMERGLWKATDAARRETGD